jgi:hypothetical protein
MPEEDLYDDDEETEPEPNPNEAKKFERLFKKQEKLAAEAQAKAAALEQKLAVRDAGLNLTQTQLDALVKVHQGEWEPDALRQTASDLGWVQTEPEPETPEPDLAGYARLTNAAGGTQEAPPADYLAMIHNAKTEDEVLDIVERLGRTTTRTSQ